MRKTFIDGTSLEDLQEEATNEFTKEVLGRVVGKSLLVGIPIAAAIGIGSHYLENAWISEEYLSQIPTWARITADVIVGYVALRGLNKIIPNFFINSTTEKVFEKDHPKGSIASKTYMRKLREKIEKYGIEGLPQEMNCDSRCDE